MLRAWANANCKDYGSNKITKSAVISNGSNSATVVLENHGFLVGHCVNFTAGAGVNVPSGVYIITGVDYTSFTFTWTTAAVSPSTGTITVNSVYIRASQNIHSIIQNASGIYTVNFATPMPDINYSTILTSDALAHHVGRYDSYLPSTTTRFSLWTVDSANNWNNADFLNIAVFR